MRGLAIPPGLSIGVMMNAAELVNHADGPFEAICRLFAYRNDLPEEIVRIACHVHQILLVMPVCEWLSASGYRVGLNLMQVADRTDEEREFVADQVGGNGIEVLYFCDGMGSLEQEQTARIVQTLRKRWVGGGIRDSCTQ